MPHPLDVMIDEGVTKIKANNISCMMDGYCFSCLGFADDLVVMTSTKDGLQEQCTVIVDCLRLGGLTEPQEVSIIGGGKNKPWLSDQCEYLPIGMARCRLSTQMAYTRNLVLCTLPTEGWLECPICSMTYKNI